MSFVLGSLSPINVTTYSGFDYPARAQVVTILSDGTSAGGNAVLQAGGNGFRQTVVGGWLTSSANVATLRGLYEALTSVTFTDNNAASFTVCVTALSITQATPTLWQWQATLVQVA